MCALNTESVLYGKTTDTNNYRKIDEQDGLTGIHGSGLK